MPTGNEYRQAAANLRGIACAVKERHEPIDRDWSDAVIGGRLSVTVRTAIDSSKDLTAVISNQVSALADECLVRAAKCDAFDAELTAYHARMNSCRAEAAIAEPGDPTPNWPTRPVPSETWITPSV